MQSTDRVKEVYDKVASAYADKFIDELSGKPLDRILLHAFARDKKGLVADFGCGPGQTTKFLQTCGMKKLLGIDLSAEMVEEASRLHPTINFEQGNLLQLKYSDAHFAAAIAFYAIVHFTIPQLKTALEEVYRILDTKGEFLFSFHIGSEVIHQEEFLDHEVDIDFYFFETETVLNLAKEIGFSVLDAIERYPYEAVEYPSKRAYIWLGK